MNIYTKRFGAELICIFPKSFPNHVVTLCKIYNKYNLINREIMKTKQLFIGLSLLIGGFTSCDNNDDNNYIPEQQILVAFESKYPNAKKVEWDKKFQYHVADFYENGREVEVWLDNMGNWVMTEINILFNSLPESVKSSFHSSEYASWKLEDVVKLEKNEMASVYIIEVERGKEDLNLYYDEEGTLIKVVLDDGEYLPSALPESIKNFVSEKYVGAILMFVDNEHDCWKIDIRHENRSKELSFDKENNWLSTSWEIQRKDVPVPIMEVILNQFSDYKIDDIDYKERATNLDVYIFELEKGTQELYVVIDIEGNIVQ